MRSGTDTLEYDLAAINVNNPVLITDVCTNAGQLRRFVVSGDDGKLRDMLKEDEAQALREIPDENQRRAALFAACYLKCTKGCERI